MRRENSALNLTRGAIIAAIYVALTYFSYIFGLSSGAVQLRISEMLCVLPAFFPSAASGLAVGCFIANMLTGCAVWDTVFGTLATLIGALGARLISRAGGSKAIHLLIPLPTVAANTLIIPLVLKYSYGADGALPFLMLTVGVGEIISAWVLGLLLFNILKKTFFLDK